MSRRNERPFSAHTWDHLLIIMANVNADHNGKHNGKGSVPSSPCMLKSLRRLR